MAHTVALITYDIADPKRLREVFETCKAFGAHLQYSVFLAHLTERGLAELTAALDSCIHHREDRVLIVRLGPDGPDLRRRFRTLGRQFVPFQAEDGIF
jgi:CRISPR-associated protein Cas2